MLFELLKKADIFQNDNAGRLSSDKEDSAKDLEGKPYILCVMVTRTSNVAAARSLITTISKQTYEYFSQKE